MLLYWYLVSTYFVTNTFTTVGFGDIVGKTPFERMWCMVIVVTAYAAMNAIFLSDCTSLLTQQYTFNSRFNTKLKLIERCLHNSKLKSQMQKYYHTFWQERKAITRPVLVDILPDSVRENLCFEMFKHPLEKCYLFEGLPVSVLKKISTRMTMGYYLPGSLVVEKAAISSTMIYIAQGVVEILTDEDEESCVLALTSGTILSACHLALVKPARANVRVVKYTTTYELRAIDLFGVLRHYPDHSARLHENLNAIILRAKKLNAMRKRKERSGGLGNLKVFNVVKDKLTTSCRNEKIRRAERWHAEGGGGGDASTKTDVDIDSDLVHFLQDFPSLYVPYQERIELAIDDICVTTKFPWVLEPSSQFITIWQTIMFLATLVSLFLVPLLAAFAKHEQKWMVTVLVLIDVITIVDAVLSLMTVIENPGERISTFSGIMQRKLKDFWFYVDVIAATPFYLMVTHDYDNSYVFRVNCILNFRKVNMFFRNLQNMYMINLTVASTFKYLTYFFLGSVWIGSIFFMLACFPIDVCSENSWLVRIENSDKENDPPQIRYTAKLWISIYFGLLVISQTAFGDIVPVTSAEYIITIVFCVVGTLLFLYLVSDFCATLNLSHTSSLDYHELVNSVLGYFKKKKMSESLEWRTIAHLEMLWLYNDGYTVLKKRPLLWDAPRQLVSDLKAEEAFKCLMSVPHIRRIGMINSKVVYDMCGMTEIVMLPPNEIVLGAGHKFTYFYIIESGVCQLVNAYGRVIKTLVKYDKINCVEMLLDKNCLYNALTRSHCRLIRVEGKCVQSALLHNFEFAYAEKCARIPKDFLKYHGIQAFFDNEAAVSIRIADRGRVEVQPNVYTFRSFIERNQPNIDFLRPFSHFGILGHLVRYALMARTFSPTGPFMVKWESSRLVFAYISSLLFPNLNNLAIVLPFLKPVAILLDIMAFVDIYVQMHVCYYDRRNLLIRHPLKTMINYLKTSFALDLVAMLPINYFLPDEHFQLDDGRDWVRTSYPLADFLRMNRLLQMWRFFGFFMSRANNIIKKGQKWIFLEHVLLSVGTLNLLSSVIIASTLTFIRDAQTEEFKMYVPTSYKPWILMYNPNLDVRDLGEMLAMHLYAFYWATEMALSAGLGDMVAQDANEMIVVCVSVSAGYLLVTYILVVVSNMRASLDKSLATYQNHMRQFIRFIDNEKVSPQLKSKLVSHFECIWSKTKGIWSHSCFANFHDTLRKDSIMFLYKSVLLKTALFQDAPGILLREVGVLLEEEHYQSGTEIVQKNDVIDFLFIVYLGKVCVVDSLGVTKRPLELSSVFGNLDDSPRVRTTLGLVAKTHATLLKLHTEKLYAIARDFPLLMKRLELSVLQNKIYLRSPVNTEPSTERTVSSKQMSTSSKWMTALAPGHVVGRIYRHIMTGVGTFSIYLYIYAISFPFESLFQILLVIDFLFIIEITLNFQTPYEDPISGEIIKDRTLIKKRYMKKYSRFFQDLLSTLPLYVVAYLPFIPEDYRYTVGSVLAANKLLRIPIVYQIVSDNMNKLDVNVMLLKGFVISYTILLLSHAFTSVWHIFRCTRYGYAPGTNKLLCNNQFFGVYKSNCDDDNYWCAMYFTLVVLTGVGFGDIVAVDYLQMIFLTMFIILSRFVLAIFVGDISNAMQRLNDSFIEFKFNYAVLKDYLKMNNVRGKVENEVLSYTKSLWSIKEGVQEPKFLRMMPSSLTQQLYLDIYGGHFRSNFVFVGCQEDFLRQMIVYVKPTVYQPGNIIVDEESVNGTCYAVHQGQVKVCSKGNTAQHDQILEEDSFFGMAQGLFENIPHKYTYRVKSVAVVLSLRHADWKYLLDFFPASRDEIYHRADMLQIDPEKTGDVSFNLKKQWK